MHTQKTNKKDSEKGKTTDFFFLCKTFYGTLKCVVLDKRFCVLEAIKEWYKKGVFSAVIIKKRRYWPNYINREEIKAHFLTRQVDTCDAQ